MRARRLLLSAASVAAVVAVIGWEIASSRTGPGPLHPAHRALEGLFGVECESCHGVGGRVDAGGCVKCHEPIGAQREAVVGLHGSLPRQQLDRCDECHSEHHGIDTPLIQSQAFVNAGVADPDAYDHRHVPGFGLVGAHVGLACERCHSEAAAAMPPAGGRFLGASQDCVACHADIHTGAFGADCQKCHGQQEPFRSAPGFEHDVFPLIGAHARVDCLRCHEPGTRHDTEALSRSPLPPRACNECHEDPHRRVGDRQPTALLLPDTADCTRCHDSTAWSAARVTPERHAEFGFPLRGGHAKATCADCHGDGTRPSRHGTSLPPVSACARCHEHPHAPGFVASAIAANGPSDGCAGCHEDADPDFRHGRTTPEQHAVTGFPLAAPHADVECRKCHDGPDRQTRFPGRKAADCRACHQDEHRGQFDGEARYAQCTACHLPTTFHPSTFGRDAHAATRFPLTGSHDAVACRRCHDEVVDDTRVLRGTATACEACHDDVHRGAFDVIGRPTQLGGRTGCARCHDTEAFAPVRASTFDHGLWTGYVLDGGHVDVQCTGCHVPKAADRQRRLGKVAGSECRHCHQDPHLGQLALHGLTQCSRCHVTESFQKVKFDHDRDSRFPLDAQHAPLACDKCHVAYPTATGSVVRYKPLGVECGDCHRLGDKEGRR